MSSASGKIAERCELRKALAHARRSKAALAAYKARGGLLGAALPQCRKLTHEAQKVVASRLRFDDPKIFCEDVFQVGFGTECFV